jgi:hypothetical protein
LILFYREKAENSRKTNMSMKKWVKTRVSQIALLWFDEKER